MASPSVAIESTIPQAEDEWIRRSSGFYACPVCKQGLEPVHDGLSCRLCERTYPKTNVEPGGPLPPHRIPLQDFET